MQATALTPILSAPAPAGPSASAPKPGNSNGPDSFAAAMNAADTRGNAEPAEPAETAPPSGRPSGRPSTRPATTAPRAPAQGQGGTPGADKGHTGTPAAGGESTPCEQTEDVMPLDTKTAHDALQVDLNPWLASLGVFARPDSSVTDAAQLGLSANAAVASALGASGAFASTTEARTTAASITGASITGASGTWASGAEVAGAELGDAATPAGLPRATGETPTSAAAPARGAAAGFSGLLGAARGADKSQRAERSEMPADIKASEAALERLALPDVATQPAAAQTVRPDSINAALAMAQPGVALAAAGLGRSAETPAEARLAATPGSQEFKDQLGAQLTTFVREGVQHARLQLHPQELGPVTVQIQIDGGSAQVNFAAEHAHTRQALEQAMPTLAGSLRECGLTLSGGGVFEQPRQPQPEPGQPDPGARNRRDSGGASDDLAVLGAAPALRRRGVVDLVA